VSLVVAFFVDLQSCLVLFLSACSFLLFTVYIVSDIAVFMLKTNHPQYIGFEVRELFICDILLQLSLISKDN